MLKCFTYFRKVIDYIERKFTGVYHGPMNSYSLKKIKRDSPLYTPVTIEWQREKCKLLKIEFKDELDKDREIIGTLLSKYVPWLVEDIVSDGNCFFRCLSKIISGSQIYSETLRQELCSYMLTDGRQNIQSYLSTKYKKDISVSEHLLTTCMYINAMWATDIEIVAMSLLLRTDIYVAEERFNTETTWRTISWMRYQGSPDNSTTDAIYIKNFGNHFEPVTKMSNGHTPSYSDEDSLIICIDLVE